MCVKSRNIGAGERTLRCVSGVVLIAVALLADLQFGWALIVLGAGIALLLTALVRYCPVNTALGRDTS